jgi:hypothetical protein
MYHSIRALSSHLPPLGGVLRALGTKHHLYMDICTVWESQSLITECLLKFDKVNVVQTLDVGVEMPDTLIEKMLLCLYDGQRGRWGLPKSCTLPACRGGTRTWGSAKSDATLHLGLADKDSRRGHLVNDNPSTNRTSTKLRCVFTNRKTQLRKHVAQSPIPESVNPIKRRQWDSLWFTQHGDTRRLAKSVSIILTRAHPNG